MAGRQAKVISPAQLESMLEHVRGRRDGFRSRVIILLSLRAGLRAAEIAKIEWHMVLDATGRVGQTIELEDRIAKKKSGRRLPLHPELKTALTNLLRRTRDPFGPVVRSRRGGAMNPNSIVNWFVSLYQELGFDGCSSHSGRRSFITAAARLKRARAVDAALYYGLSEGEYNYDVRVPAEVFTIGSGTSLFDIDFEDFRMALAFLQRNWHPSDHVEIAQNSEQNHDQEDEDEEDDEE